MTDPNPCPSCREPLDHPSGDGCANMTAHKEKAMGMAAISDAPEQIWLGRDERYQGEPWIRLTSDFDEECETQEYIRADRIEQLVATIEALTKERDRFEAALGRACLVGGTTYLIEQRDAAQHDAKEAEAYAEELEKELNTCRMAQAVMDNTVAGLEAKLAKAVEALENVHRFGVITHPAIATLAEISSEAALNKGESHE